jgi:hypothetical protein
MIRLLTLLAALPLLAACAAYGQAQAQAPTQAQQGTWYFAVSGDSRDCGDLIMPKIAHAVAEDREHPAAFYWHLGDFRRMYGPDCDVVKRTYPDWDCADRTKEEAKLGPEEMSQYLNAAWDDFIERQIHPFAPTPVFLGIGNHELGAGRTPLEFQRKFQPWLTSQPIHLQRLQEADDHFYSNEGDTYYHFVKNGIDFIYLDNASPGSFSAAQIKWLEKVLSREKDDVTTIIVGMHAALPYSKQSRHAMDASCQGLCSGQQVYDLLYRMQIPTQTLPGKHVYVFASHSHLFVDNLFDTDEHKGQVLTGWLVGTAGAEQYRKPEERIQYGYALVAVHPGGTLDVQLREVTRDSPPLATGPGAEPLTKFCFEQNKQDPDSDAFKGNCMCGEARP